MLKRLVALVVFALTLSAIPAFAQYTVIDANGTVVGNVVTVITPDNDVSKVAVATQDANGLWVFMELVKEGFILSGLSEIMNTLVYYTDAACATTPYLAFPGGPPQFTPTPLFRRLVSGRRGEVVTQGYYGTDPVAIITVRSYALLSDLSSCLGPVTFNLAAGPMTTFDLTQFVPPFSVQPFGATATQPLSQQRK